MTNKAPMSKREKYTYPMINPVLVDAATVWPNTPEVVGKFALVCDVLNHDGSMFTKQYRTSMLLSYDIEAGRYETTSSVYQLVIPTEEGKVV